MNRPENCADCAQAFRCSANCAFFPPEICSNFKRKTNWINKQARRGENNNEKQRREEKKNSVCWNWCIVVDGRQQLIVRKIRMQPDERYGGAHALFAHAFYTKLCFEWKQCGARTRTKKKRFYAKRRREKKVRGDRQRMIWLIIQLRR